MESNFWNERFSQTNYVYGTEPNAYFKSIIDQLPPGKVLIPGAGEGRDAVYAATRGWEVTAFDLSTAGKEKALRLAAQQGVHMDYHITDAADFMAIPGYYDAVGLIFFHLPSAIRTPLYLKIQNSLRAGGTLILQSFHPLQLGNTSGGPKDVDLLYAAADALTDWPGLELTQREEMDMELNEGAYHVGKANVTCVTGVKR